MDGLNNVYCLSTIGVYHPIDETTVDNSALLSEYKMLQVRIYLESY